MALPLGPEPLFVNRPLMDDNALLALARRVLELEAAAISEIAENLPAHFLPLIAVIKDLPGQVIVSGVGKAGWIGQKISATLASTGTSSHFIHPTEALHGDLGRLRKGDLALLLSNSGESEEVIALIDPLRRLGVPIAAMVGEPNSRLGKAADYLLEVGRRKEACPLGMAPTTSTAALLAMGDALAMTLLEARQFSLQDFARFHPAGALGRKLLLVEEIMRSGDRMTTVPIGTRVKDTLIAMNRTKGRPGAAMVLAADGRLAGFFTDGDLARHLERDSSCLERPIEALMIENPIAIAAGRLATEALALLRERRIDQVPVLDADRRPLGLVDVQDLLDARII